MMGLSIEKRDSDADISEVQDNLAISKNAEKRVELPDDCGERYYKSELPDDSGDKAAKAKNDSSVDEKRDLKEKMGWTDKQINKCTIDENGTILFKTDREDLEGKESENGVKYERKTVNINGIKVEGVFPVFDSAFNLQLPVDKETASNAVQFKECNKQLKDSVENNPNLRDQFSGEQLDEISDGNTPSEYTWHHNEEQSKMQLVKTEDHGSRQ